MSSQIHHIFTKSRPGLKYLLHPVWIKLYLINANLDSETVAVGYYAKQLGWFQTLLKYLLSLLVSGVPVDISMFTSMVATATTRRFGLGNYVSASSKASSTFVGVCVVGLPVAVPPGARPAAASQPSRRSAPRPGRAISDAILRPSGLGTRAEGVRRTSEAILPGIPGTRSHAGTPM